MTTSICSRAPVRICDIGGWTDTHYYGKGKVTNFAINLFSYVRVEPNHTRSTHIYSENLDLDTEIVDYRKVEYDGVLDLLKAAVKRMEVEEGLNIFVRADAPPGCGTGTSASVAVALISALAYYKGRPFLPFQAAKSAHSLETEELGLESGVQDQYTAAYGCISHMEIEYPLDQIAPIQVSPMTTCQIESQWVLVYLGSRKSSEMHLQVIDNFRKGDPSIIKAHNRLKDLAGEMVIALQRGDMRDVARIMNENWECQQKLHPVITNQRIKELEQLAREFGAVGFKVNGAGGGGSAVIMMGCGNEYRLKKRLLEDHYVFFPCILNFHGVQVWTETKNDH